MSIKSKGGVFGRNPTFNSVNVEKDVSIGGDLNASNLNGNVTGNVTSSNASITGGSVNGTTVGATTPSTGSFTTLAASGNTTIGGTLDVTGASTFGGLLSSQVISSGSVNISNLTYRNIVTMSDLEPNTLYQYYVTIDATDSAYLAIGLLNYSSTLNVLIPLYTGGATFSPNSNGADVQISDGVFQYRQKSGGTQLGRWRVSRLFRGR